MVSDALADGTLAITVPPVSEDLSATCDKLREALAKNSKNIIYIYTLCIIN